MNVMSNSNLEIEIIPSPNDPFLGAHVGVRIRHKTLALISESISKKTQYANKLAAICVFRFVRPAVSVSSGHLIFSS